MANLTPFVYWAQTETNVTLKVDLKDVIDPVSKASDGEFSFSAKGVGGHGLNDYSFRIDLYSKVDSSPDRLCCKLYDSKVEIILVKRKPTWWPRLTSQPQKPVWLKIDFDRWKSEEDGGLEDSDGDRRDVMSDYPGMYDKLQKEEMGYRKEDLKKVYLVLYNTFQFVGFMYILCVLGVRYSKYGVESMTSSYEHVGAALKFLQLLQYLEVMHPLFGYTQGGVITPFIQVTGRTMLLFAMIDAEPRMQTKPVVFYLIILWSAIEVVRYPYYITQLYNKKIYLLTWLRYSLWIPLYPLGILCEGIIILRNIPYFEETQKFSVALPNRWNFSFHTPSVMRLYLLLLFLPGLYTMMMHMYRARVKKLSTRKVVIKKSK